MVSLIITVISIGFFAILLLAGTNYMNFDAIQEIKGGGQIQHGFLQLTTGYLTFQELHREDPSALSDVVPAIVLEPPLPPALSWSYDETYRSWFCVSGIVNDPGMFGMAKARYEFSSDAATLAGSCGATADSMPSIYPATAALTYYVRIP